MAAATDPLNTLGVLSTHSLKRRIVRRLHMLSYQSGLSSAYARLSASVKGDSPACILMYHCVPAAREVPWIDPRNAIAADLFEQQMQFLARHRHVISIDQLTTQLVSGEPFCRGTVAITLDDGYLNNLRVAAPILAKYQLPATVYLATNYINAGKNQWIDTLYGAFVARSRHRLSLSLGQWHLEAGQSDAGQSETDQSEVMRAYDAIARHLITTLPPERQSLLDEIDRQLAPSDYPPNMTMTWDDVRELKRRYANITLGVHTANHIDLCAHGDLTEEEMALSIAQVLAETGDRPQHFAFPYNRYSEQSIAVVAEHVRSAVAVAPDPVVRSAMSPTLLPRLDAPRSMTLLKSWTNGGFPDVSQRLWGQVWARPA